MSTSKFIIPPALRKGDTIAFVSPSSRYNEQWPAALARAKAHFESLGFAVTIIYSPLRGTFVQQVAQRVDELHQAFRDTNIKAIVCTIGGDNANELLRHLDYDLIRKNAKIFCGYSDTTNLHGALLTQAGLRTFYGPAGFGEFGDYPKPMDFTTDHFLHVLCNAPGKPIGAFPRSKEWATELNACFTSDDQALEVPRPLKPSPNWQWVRNGKGTGRIIGGVLTSLLELAGTKFWPNFFGAILLIESSFGNTLKDPVSLAKTRYQLADLANIGVFDEINGLVFGRQVSRNDKLDSELAQLLLDQTHGKDFPILMNIDVGHTDPMLTVPLDALVRLDSEKDEWVGLEPAVV